MEAEPGRPLSNNPLNPRMNATQTRSTNEMSVWERRTLNVLLLAALIWGVCVVCRATLSANRSTDLGVYFAAAQAVREHSDLYGATYNGNHYQYPPLLALLLANVVPAPPKLGLPVSAAFAIADGVWYLLSLLALGLSVRVLAASLTRSWAHTNPALRTVWRPVWTLRLLPVLVCLHCLGRELQLGQVDLFMLAFVSFAIAAAAEGRSVSAGLWVAAGICLKGMPLLLLLYPLWRRDWRWLLSSLGGLALGLIVLPVVAFGYDGASRYTREYADVLLLPALTGKVTDHSRDEEMLNQNAVHNYSLLGVLHNLENLSTPRDQRPKTASARNRQWAAAVGTALILITLLASGIRRQVSPLATILCLTMLVVLMLIVNPVCQSYVFVLLIPAIMAVCAADMERSGRVLPRPAVLGVLAAYVVAQAASSFSPFVRDSGLVLATVLALWFAGLMALRECNRAAMIKPSAAPVN